VRGREGVSLVEEGCKADWSVLTEMSVAWLVQTLCSVLVGQVSEPDSSCWWVVGQARPAPPQPDHLLRSSARPAPDWAVRLRGSNRFLVDKDEDDTS